MSRLVAGFSDNEDDDELLEQLNGLSLAQLTRPATPSSSAGLNGSPFDKEMSNQEYEMRLKCATAYSAYNKSPRTQEIFNSCFNLHDNPFQFALKLFISGENYQNCKSKSFTYFVLEAFKVYVDECKRSKCRDLDPLLDDHLKMVAFNVTKASSKNLFQTVIDAFQLASPTTAVLFQAHLDQLVARGQYAEATNIVTDLKILPSVDYICNAILMPLFFSAQPNINQLLYNCLLALPSVQRPFIQALDQLLGDKDTRKVCEKMQQTHKYVNLNADLFTMDHIRNGMKKLVKRFNFQMQDFHHCNQYQMMAAITFLIGRYKMGELAPEVLADNIKVLVPEDNLEMQVYLVRQLVARNFGMEAIKWMEHYKFDIEDMPEQLQQRLAQAQRLEAGNRVCLKVSAKPSPLAYKLNLRKVKLCQVATDESFRQMCALLGACGRPGLITMDTESQPSFNRTQQAALFQLATGTHIFIVDMLSETLNAGHWQLLSDTMANDEIVKVGFGFHNDLQVLENGRGLSALVATLRHSVLHMDGLWVYVENKAVYKRALGELPKAHGQGMKDLVKVFLGKELDKTQQFSNWASRPLTKQQLEYAASDAYALLEVYNVMWQRFTEAGVDFNNIIAEFKRRK